MSVTLTPLQESLAAFGAVLDEARATLGLRQWVTFVDVACQRVGTEAAKLTLTDLLGERDDRREKAA